MFLAAPKLCLHHALDHAFFFPDPVGRHRACANDGAAPEPSAECGAKRLLTPLDARQFWRLHRLGLPHAGMVSRPTPAWLFGGHAWCR